MNAFPEWHDANGWMEIVRGLKKVAGAEGVTIEFNMPHGIHTYQIQDGDE